MIPKAKGAEDSCPSCHQILVCREKEYKGETSLQWQYKDREEAHFSFDFKTKKYRDLNVAIVIECVSFYNRCWKYRNEILHDDDKQKE